LRRTSSVDRDAALAACGRAYYGHGKLEVLPKFNVASLGDIATLYTPGVAYSVQEIIARPDALHELSTKDNMIVVGRESVGQGERDGAAGG
jgi:malate dehydrogenase (oxaloacetate-decarboxylating)